MDGRPLRDIGDGDTRICPIYFFPYGWFKLFRIIRPLCSMYTYNALCDLGSDSLVHIIYHQT
jgi:hypothetical protein